MTCWSKHIGCRVSKKAGNDVQNIYCACNHAYTHTNDKRIFSYFDDDDDTLTMSPSWSLIFFFFSLDKSVLFKWRFFSSGLAEAARTSWIMQCQVRTLVSGSSSTISASMLIRLNKLDWFRNHTDRTSYMTCFNGWPTSVIEVMKWDCLTNWIIYLLIRVIYKRTVQYLTRTSHLNTSRKVFTRLLFII